MNEHLVLSLNAVIDMKVRVLSDLHLEYEKYSVENVGEDLLILCGDILPINTKKHVKSQNRKQMLINFIRHYLRSCPPNTLPYNVLMVLGNHDYYHCTMSEVDSFYRNLRIPKFKCLINDHVQFEYEGVDYAFVGSTLWSDMLGLSSQHLRVIQKSINDYNKIYKVPKQLITPEDIQHLFVENKRYVEKMLLVYNKQREVTPDRKLVCCLLTHHLPSHKSISPAYYEHALTNRAYYSNLDYLHQYVDYFFHGHTHSSQFYALGDATVVCNPKGYNDENPAFDPNLIIEM